LRPNGPGHSPRTGPSASSRCPNPASLPGCGFLAWRHERLHDDAKPGRRAAPGRPPVERGRDPDLGDHGRPARRARGAGRLAARSGNFANVTRQLQAYFAGQLTTFDLDLAPGGTPFQQRIWRALDSVPYGTTISYGQLAARLGVPRDRIQALGAAIGANPLAIIRPCHRVIGSDGGMRGYAGGTQRKQQLLVHEGALLGASW
jgi:O-6-methylguanine DNA methyltransferase